MIKKTFKTEIDIISQIYIEGISIVIDFFVVLFVFPIVRILISDRFQYFGKEFLVRLLGQFTYFSQISFIDLLYVLSLIFLVFGLLISIVIIPFIVTSDFVLWFLVKKKMLKPPKSSCCSQAVNVRISMLAFFSVSFYLLML